MRLRNSLITGFLFLGTALFLPYQCRAVNFYDGARAAKGLYGLSYTSYYSADKTTDKDGNTSIAGYDYKKSEELLRFCYYTPETVFTALVPFGRAESGYYSQSSEGLGDINLGVGRFLGIKEVDILPMLFLKFPSGEYDPAKSVNYGSNQYDIKPMVFFYKDLDRFSIDAAAKYYFRQENKKTGISAGDELYLQCLLGWKVNDKCKFGPSFNWMQSTNRESEGTETEDTARRAFSLGADLYFRLPGFSLTFTYLNDIYSRNTTQGDFFQIKMCHKF